MTYSQLTIHQKINCKNNAMVLYPSSPMVLRKLISRDPDCFTPNRLYVK